MSNRDFKLEKTNRNVEAILSEVRRLLKELGPPIVSKVNIEDLTKEKMIGGHIGVATWLCRRNGDFVFVKHRTMPNKWMTVAGRVEKNEGILEAIKREAREETGLEIDVKKLLLITLVPGRNILFIKFLSVETGGTLNPIDLEEIIEARAFKKDEIPKEELRFEDDREFLSRLS